MKATLMSAISISIFTYKYTDNSTLTVMLMAHTINLRTNELGYIKLYDICD